MLSVAPEGSHYTNKFEIIVFGFSDIGIGWITYDSTSKKIKIRLVGGMTSVRYE